MSWSVQAKRNIIGVVWMTGGLVLLLAAMKDPIYLSALVLLAIVLFVLTQRLSCPRCHQRIAPVSGGNAVLRRLPDACSHCGLKTTDRP